jgi:8-oxo-dGTP pyrophosphatase MutT (NUDIX family)
MAIALHRRYGYPIRMLTDADGTIAHVYNVDEKTGEAIDVKGRRTEKAIADHFWDLKAPKVVHLQGGENELRNHMGDFKPLHEHSESEINEADQYFHGKHGLQKREFAAILAVFNSKGEILLGKRRDNGKWTCPGGHREEGEEPEETAIRELKEEAGLTTDNLGHLGEGMVQGRKGETHVHVFKTVTDDKPDSSGDPDEEVESWEWVPTRNGLPKEIYENMHVPPVKNLLFPLCDVDLVPADQDEEDWEDEYGREFELQKSLADVPRGKRVANNHLGVTYAYNHVLPEPLLRDGYRLQVRHATSGGVYGGAEHHQMIASLLHGTECVGTVGGAFDPKGKKLGIRFSSLEKEHRGKGLGKAAYEALMAHAYHSGASAVEGREHSTAANAVHNSLSAKHGFEYKAPANPKPASKTPDDFDERYGHYQYLLKGDQFDQFEQDVVSWCVFNEGLEKGLKHSLMGLAAATMLQMSPSKVEAPKPAPSAPTQQAVEQPPAEQPLPRQELNSHMKAVIKNPTTLQPKSVGMTGDQGQSVDVPKTKMPAKNYSMAWHYQGLPREMMAIARNESAGGALWSHAKNLAGPFWTAYGPLGMKPATAYDEFRMPHMAAVRKTFPGLEDPREFMNEFRINPNLYNAVATGHWNRLIRTAGGNDELAAYGWNQGLGALQTAMANGHDVGDHDYVSKYRQHKQRLMGQLAAR